MPAFFPRKAKSSLFAIRTFVLKRTHCVAPPKAENPVSPRTSAKVSITKATAQCRRGQSGLPAHRKKILSRPRFFPSTYKEPLRRKNLKNFFGLLAEICAAPDTVESEHPAAAGARGPVFLARAVIGVRGQKGGFY